MQLQLQTFATLVANTAAAIQGAARQLLDLTVGSTLRAIVEANASVALWLQWLILQVLRTTRASTSIGADLDSWMADFGLIRLPAVAASGAVTFARFTPSIASLVPAGTTVRTADGSQAFTVAADTTNPAWSAAQNGLLLPAGTPSLAALVTAVTPGSLGNVQPNTVTLIAAALPGVDTVTNQGVFAGGVDAESDPAFRYRFQTFLDSRSRATVTALAAAIVGVQQGLHFVIAENTLPDGTSRPGCITVTLDDGTGVPSAVLLANVANALEEVRPIGSIVNVRAPIVIRPAIALAVQNDASAGHADVVAAVAGALTAYVDSLDIGVPLAWSRLAQVAYDAHPAVTNVGSILLAGGTADVTPLPTGVVRAGNVAVF